MEMLTVFIIVFSVYKQYVTVEFFSVKTRTAMNMVISVLVICVETVIYLLLYKLHDCTFNGNKQLEFSVVNDF